MDTTAGSITTNAIKDAATAIDERLDRLMHAYLDKAMTLEEYRPAKTKLIEEKKQKEGEIEELERHRSGWFEPAIGFVEAAKHAAILASSHDHAEKLKFAKTTGSNFQLLNRELVALPRDAWNIVLDQGSFAQSPSATPLGVALGDGETRLDLKKRRLLDSVRTFFKDNPTWK
jgi:hypothetical protein